MQYSQLTVIIPTFNEEKNIGGLITTLIDLYPGVTIIVADDGSKDKTQGIVQTFHTTNENILLLNREQCKIHGLTASVVDAALSTTTPFFVVIDGDFQHPPEKIKEMLELLEKDADVVVGTREKVASEWGLYRQLMSKTATGLGWMRLLLFNKPFTKDVMSGFFGTKTELFKKHAKENYNRFEHAGYKVLFDYLKILPKKTNIASVNYTFGLRLGGTSKISKKHMILYLKSLFK